MAIATDYTHVFEEAGNGFPEDGDKVLHVDDLGNIHPLRLISTSPIHTAQGRPNYVYCVCERHVDPDYDDEDAECPIVRKIRRDD